MKKLLNLLCLTRSAQMKMVLPPGREPEVQACISILMPKETEGESSGNVALALVLDVSGSTGGSIAAEGADNQIWKAIKNAAVKTVHLLGDGDKVTIITFDDSGNVVLPISSCNAEGKDAAIAAIENSVYPQGGTNYIAGLQAARNELVKATGMTRAMGFNSDGGHETRFGEPTALAKEIRDSGVVIYTAAVSDNLTAEQEARLKDMSGGANFAACIRAEDVEAFYKASLRKAQRAAITNTRLEFEAIGLVQKIQAFDMVLRNGNRAFVTGTITPKTGSNPAKGVVNIGEIAPGDRVDCFVWFQTRLKKFAEDLTEQKATFGRLAVYGACVPMGITDPVELEHDEMYQRFARITSGTINLQVEKVVGQHAAAKGFDQASRETDAAKQQQIIAEAAEKVRRATQVCVDDEDLTGDLADLNDLKQKSATQGAKVAGKDAGRKTTVAVDEDE